MVTVKLYLEKFSRAMKERSETIRSLIQRRDQLNKQLRENTNPEQVRNELLAIYGSAPKLQLFQGKPKPTLQHQLWKVKKSIEFTIKRRHLFASLAQESGNTDKEVAEYLSKVFYLNEKVLYEVTRLQQFYEDQEKDLKNKNYTAYFGSIHFESEHFSSSKNLMGEIKDSARKGKALLTQRSSLLNETNDSIARGIKNSRGEAWPLIISSLILAPPSLFLIIAGREDSSILSFFGPLAVVLTVMGSYGVSELIKAAKKEGSLRAQFLTDYFRRWAY